MDAILEYDGIHQRSKAKTKNSFITPFQTKLHLSKKLEFFLAYSEMFED